MSDQTEILEILLRSKADVQGYADLNKAQSEAVTKAKENQKVVSDLTTAFEKLNRLGPAEGARQMKTLAQAYALAVDAGGPTVAQTKALSAELDRLKQTGAEVPAILRDIAAASGSAAGSTSKFVDTLKAGFGIGAGASVAVLGAQAIVGALKAIPETLGESGRWAEKLQNLNTTLGFGVQQLQVYQMVAKETGISFEAITSGAVKLEQKVGEGDASIARLGLDLEKLREMKPGEIFEQVTSKIAELGTQQERVAATVAIFGRGAADEYLPFIEKLRDADEMADRLNRTLSVDQVAALGMVDDALDRLGRRWDEVKRKASAAMAPFALALLNDPMRFLSAMGAAAMGTPGAGASLLGGNGMWGAQGGGEGGGDYTSKQLEKEIAEGERVLKRAADFWDRRQKALEKEHERALKWMSEHPASMYGPTDEELYGGYNPTHQKAGPLGSELLGEDMIGDYGSKSRRRIGSMLSGTIELEGGKWGGTAAHDKVTKLSGFLRELTRTMEAFGISADSAFGKLIAGLNSGLALGEQVRRAVGGQIFGSGGKGWGNLSGGQKTAAALGGLDTAFAAYGSGSMLGGAMSGASFGASVGGPWGALIGGGIGGILGLFGKSAKERKEAEALKQQMLETYGGMDALQKKARELGIDIDKAFASKKPAEVKAAMDAMAKAMEDQRKRIAGFDDSSAGIEKFIKGGGNVAHASMYAVGAFAGYVRETGDLLGALDKLGPALDELAKKYKEAGTTGSAAIQELLGMREVLAGNEDLAQQLSGLQQLMKGLADQGMITREMFEAFGQDAVSIYNDLMAKQDESVPASERAARALALMRPTLQQLWEQQQKFGRSTDEATNALLDEAEQQGLVGEQFKSTGEQILTVLKDIAKALGAVTGTHNTQLNIHTTYTDEDRRTVNNGGSGRGGDKGGDNGNGEGGDNGSGGEHNAKGGIYGSGSWWNLPRAARGMMVNRPGQGTHVIAGEKGPEVIAPVDALFKRVAEYTAQLVSGTGRSLVFNISGAGDPKAVAREVLELIEANSGGTGKRMATALNRF